MISVTLDFDFRVPLPFLEVWAACTNNQQLCVHTFQFRHSNRECSVVVPP